jgi:hypothetical protein
MKVEEMLEKLKPLWGNYTQRLWKEYVLADPETRRAIEAALQIALARNLDCTFEETQILLEPPPASCLKGEYQLGKVLYGTREVGTFFLRESEWIQHIGIFGRSGSGKTNTALVLLWNLLRKNKPFLVFDWKRNYRDLLATRAGRRILVFTVGRDVSPFFFNPLVPPAAVSPAIWLKKLIEIMAHAYFLGEGVSYLLQKAFDSVYRQYGIYDGQPEVWPTLRDVSDWLINYKATGREAAWMDSALRAVGVLCFGEMGRVLNQRTPFPVDELLKENVILELDTLTNSDKVFLIESLLLWIHHFRMAQGDRERFKHAILIEEAHHILLGKKQEIMGTEAITDIILREIRELGEAIVLIDQHPSLISKPALGNTYTTIAMNLKHRSDVNMISDAMLLDAKRARHLGRLEVGESLVKLQGRWTDPFLVRFPHMQLEKGAVGDEEVHNFRKHWRGFSEVIRSGDGLHEPPDGPAGEIRVLRSRDKGGAEDEGQARTGAEELLVKDILDRPGSGVSERYTRLGLSAYQGNLAKGRLLNKGLIREKEVRTRTGRVKVLELTPKGRKVLEGRLVKVSNRKGGTEHRFWMDQVGRVFKRAGYRVRAEVPIGGGKTTDLVAAKDGRTVAIEVETGSSDAACNIKKNLDHGFSTVLCVATGHRAYDKLRRQVSSTNLLDNPRVRLTTAVELVDG